MKQIFIIINYCLLTIGVYAQVGIGISNPNPNSELDIVSTDKGVLLPRIELKSINDFHPIKEPVSSLLVYNTTVNKTLELEEGFYYWSNNRWNLLINSKHVNNLTGDNKSIKTENKVISAEADKAIWNAGSIKGVDIEVGNLADGDMLKYKGGKWTATAETVVRSNSFLAGTENPSEKLGKEGDFYLNLKDGELYNKGKDKWDPKGSFKGAHGEQGADGALSITEGNGINILDKEGKKIISARVNEAIWNASKIKGINIDETQPNENEVLKYNKNKNMWILAKTVATSNSFLTGEGEPLDESGEDGDVYLNQSNNFLYKKDSGTWHRKKLLQGDQGSRGSDGSDKNSWALDGNYSSSSSFLGTKNGQPLVFKTNGETRMLIMGDGKTGLNTTSPTAQLHTIGSVRMQGLKEMPNAKYDVVMDEESNLGWRKSQTIPMKSVVLFCGGINNIPADWYKCDGSHGTPKIETKVNLGLGQCFYIMRN